jgi:hypothetical protein
MTTMMASGQCNVLLAEASVPYDSTVPIVILLFLTRKITLLWHSSCVRNGQDVISVNDTDNLIVPKPGSTIAGMPRHACLTDAEFIVVVEAPFQIIPLSCKTSPRGYQRPANGTPYLSFMSPLPSDQPATSTPSSESRPSGRVVVQALKTKQFRCFLYLFISIIIQYNTSCESNIA